MLAVLLGTLAVAAALAFSHRPRCTMSKHLKRIRLPRIKLGAWRHRLGDKLESPACLILVILLIALDISATLVVLLTESGICGEMLEGRPSELAETVGELARTRPDAYRTLACALPSLPVAPRRSLTPVPRAGFGCLCTFFIEQILHVIAFGRHFLDHPWFVGDLFVVSISIAMETAAIDLVAGTQHEAKVLRVFKAWRLAALIFDFCLEGHEIEELQEEWNEEAEHKKE